MTFKPKLSKRLAIGRCFLLLALGAGAACNDDPTGTITSSLPTMSVTSFAPGDRVKTSGTANIRSGPSVSATLLGTQPPGALGTILAGPVIDSAGDKLLRWDIDFDSGVDGWAAEPYVGLILVAPANPAPVASVVLTPAAASLTIGGTVQLRAEAKDSAGTILTGQTMSWVSRDTLIAKVSAAGLVTALAAGSALVIATSGGASDTAAITVTAPAVASVSVIPATATLEVGKTVQLSASVKDSAGTVLSGRTTSWTSSSTAVATVSAAGLVTAIASGTATITATSEGKSGTATVAVTAVSAPVVHAGYYVSPNGSSANTGSMSRPWTLSYALGTAGGRIHAGDTVWVRGGTYRGGFRSTLTGLSGAPIVVRQYPGEQATVDAAGYTGDQFVVAGSWSVFWGLELMNSEPTRTFSTTSNNARPNLLVNNGSHNKYINLVVHDGGVAFFNYSARSDVEVYGSIWYNNGWQGPDRGHGHALYIKSDVGPLVVRDNVIFNQYGYGIHAYTNTGSGLLNNIWVEGNVSFDNGTLSSSGTSANIGNLGQPPANDLTMLANMTYMAPGLTGTNLTLGSGSGLRATGNYVVGGSGITQGTWTNATVSGNTVLAAGPAARQTAVFVRPNAYEQGRATVTVYNWSQLGAVSVDLSGIVPVGARYEVRNVQNLYGAPVATGEFSGAVSIPLGGVTPPTPVGLTSSRSPRTGPYFDVFLVTILP
ncbi:MAG TPA: Ig-like domain-containing protein [Gemmatimonadales bacterium]|nr:Ig-like domain-containing protein [Gemmatimonadales bacterium]